ncbi:uncharacterized protein LOC133926038 [Phragmites australis]|uniref:uncharacterized protein LOC133926038 n=1 Tax=Phragmites australis TaxID=29695 RepID=UPI002D78359F|nr:uncharacterized protein LOC133926038 [Phragmites australis]
MEVKFFSMPQSIKPVTDFIQENGGTLVRTEILAGRFNECVARDIGMMVVQRSIAEVFRAHAAVLTWDGAFDITDFVVINDEEIKITKEPVPGEAAHRAHDLHRIGFIYMPFFTENGRMALYFSVLHHDLINAGENDIMEEWFREYILYHTALRPSPARYSLCDWSASDVPKIWCCRFCNPSVFSWKACLLPGLEESCSAKYR